MKRLQLASDYETKMSEEETYKPRSQCPITNVLDIVGDRWTLAVVRDMLLLGKHEYKEFLEGQDGIATNILADRLKKLSCAGIVQQFPHPENKNRKFYYLTERGKQLLPMMIEMIIWGATHLSTVRVPPRLLYKLKNNREQFVKETLQAMSDWEKKILHEQNKS